MSTNILREYLNQISVKNSKIYSVDIKSETLGQFIRRRRDELGLSILEVERRSRIGGKKGISNGYITLIENDNATNLSSDKIKALAVGLGIPEFEILKVAGFKNNLTPESESLQEVYGFLSGYEDLDEEDKEEMKPTLVMIANEIRRRLTQKREK